MSGAAENSAGAPWRRLAGFTHEALLLALLAGLLLLALRVEPKFVTARYQAGLYSQMWDVALLALPMTFIIITAGIDLSIGAIMALASVALGIALTRWQWNFWCAGLAAMTVGALCGMLNGFFVTRVKVHPLIVTLATMSAFRGLAEGISLPDTYAVPDQYYDLAKYGVHWRLGLPEIYPPGEYHLYGLQISGWLFVVLAALCAFLLARTAFGRSLYAIGHNELAAQFSGIRTDRIKLVLYTFSGLMAGLVAVNVSAGQSTAKADVGAGIELDVITAVVLGGASIFGGRGRTIGTVLGVILIHETRQFVKVHYRHDEWVAIVLGLLLIVAVAANALFVRRARK